MIKIIDEYTIGKSPNGVMFTVLTILENGNEYKIICRNNISCTKYKRMNGKLYIRQTK